MLKSVRIWICVGFVLCAVVPLPAYAQPAEKSHDQRAQAIIKDARKFSQHQQAPVAAKLLEQAINAFQADRDKSPDDGEIALALARLQYELQRDEDAAKNLEQAIQLQPKLAAARTFKGLTLLQTGKTREAEAEYLQVIELAPQDPLVKCEYARYLFSTNRAADGAKQVRAAYELNPGHSEAAILFGSVLEQSGKSPEALQVARRAVELNDKDIPLRETLGSVYHATDKHAEAYEQFAAVVKLDPDYIDAEIRLLQLASALQKPAEIKQHYGRIYELHTAGKSFGDSFRRERFQVGKHPVVAMEFFELKGATPVKYRFLVFDEAGKENIYRINLGSYDFTTELGRAAGTVKATERMYHLDYYRGTEHRTYGMYPATPPTYDQIRKLVVEIIEGTRPALSASSRAKE